MRGDRTGAGRARRGVAPEPTAKRITHATLGPLHLLQPQSPLAHKPTLRLRVLVPAEERNRQALAGTGAGPGCPCRLRGPRRQGQLQVEGHLP